jgi:hypothetical protein
MSSQKPKKHNKLELTGVNNDKILAWDARAEDFITHSASR